MLPPINPVLRLSHETLRQFDAKSSKICLALLKIAIGQLGNRYNMLSSPHKMSSVNSVAERVKAVDFNTFLAYKRVMRNTFFLPR